MRKFYVLLSVLFVCLKGYSQTTLVNSTFETGDATAWSFANSNPNAWVAGNAVAASGTRSVYISNNNGGSNNYVTGVSTVSHVYTPVTFPSGQGAILLSFDVKGIGEHSSAIYDYVRVSLTASAPVAGTMPSVTEQLPIFLSAYTSFNRVWVAIPSTFAGTTKNLVFTFRAENAGGSTAFALDNIKVTSAAVVALSGTKNIKAIGGNYSSFSEAIATLNANGANGAVTFNVDAGTTFNETPTAITPVSGTPANIVFQKSGTGANPKIIATGSGNNRTVSSGTITTNTDAVIALAGADRIVFDGIDFASADYQSGESAIEYGVYIYNTSAVNGAQNNIIQNAAITLNRTNLETRAILQDVAVTPTSPTGANSNNKYYNLAIANTFAGIELQGNSTYPDLATEVGTTSCTISNTIGAAGTPNDIGNGAAQTWGVRAVNQSGVKIFNNKISNVTTTGSGAASPVDGILITGFLGVNEVYNNQITGITAANGTSSSSASGINLAHATLGTHSIRVYNNFISGITHGYTGAVTANRYIKGIFISGTGGATTQTYAIDFNSVRIDGSASPNTSSATLEVSTTSGPVYFIRNNILSNFTNAQSGAARHYGIVSTSYQRTGNTGSITSYNDLYIGTGTGGFVAGGGVGNTPTTYSVDIPSFQAAFTDNNVTANNLSLNPAFVSVTDLHSNATGLNGTADPAYATASPWILKDIDCETRSATAADIGADEFTLSTTTCAVPSNPTTLSFTNITASNASGTFIVPAIAPTGYVVVRSEGVLSASPVNGTSYAVNNTIGNGTVISVGAAANFSVAGVNANTSYTITVFSFNNINCTNGPVYNTTTPLANTFATCPSTPASPAAISLSPSSFSVNFTSSKAGGAAVVSYSLEVATDAAFTTPVSGSPFAFTDTTTAQTTMTYTITGLNASTMYYYRLKANGCNSNAVTGSVSTWCNAVPVPYAEGFEGIAAANNLPVCMTASPAPATGGKTQTFVAAATGTNTALVAHTGTKFAAVYYSPNGAGYFFSAPLQLTGGVAYTASVYYQTDGAAWPAAGLKYGTAATVADMTTSIVTVTNAAATTYTQITGTFTPATTGVYYVSFYADNINVNTPNYIAFDDFTVDAGASCTAPVIASAIGITATGATLNWNAAVPAPASYEIYYTTSSTAPTSATQPNATGITGTSKAITGLSASTTYYGWVRSNCGSSVSAWSASSTFSTLCLAANIPYSENFDGATVPNLPTCTTREDLNNDGSTWTTAAAPAGYTGKVLQYTYNLTNAANDWFYTAGLNLTAGTSYTLTFKYSNSSSIGIEKLKVAYGNSPVAGAMTNLLQDYSSIAGNVISTAVLTFTPASTGVYYIGFQAYSAVNQFTLYLDNIAVTATSTLPANDEATGAFTLTVGNGCVGAAYTNAGATKSTNEVFPSCSGTGQAPVWFKFVATSSAVRVSTDVGSGNTLTDSKIALFSATDPANYGSFTILSCDDDNGSVLGSGNMSVLYATGLTIGNTYYIAVDKSSAAAASGSFCLTVDELSSSMLSANSQCASPLQQVPVGSNAAYAAQVPLVDGSSKLIAIIKNSGGDAVSSYSPSVVASTVQRQFGGRYYLNRNFTVNNTSSKIASIQLFFLATELASLNATDGTTLPTLAVTRQSGSGCQADFTPGIGIATPLLQLSNGVTDGVNWIEVPLPTGLSNLYINRVGVVLPVHLLSFAGQRQGANNLLKWTVEQEQDIAVYNVERSENNRDWTVAGSVSSLGNATGQRTYSFTDNNVQGTRQYYRLRQVDKNGAAKLSNTIVINGLKVSALTLNGLFPNPAASKLNMMIETPLKSKLAIFILDAVGKVVRTQTASVEAGANTVSLDITGLAQGSYLVKVTCGEDCQTITSKFVKE